jgi:NADPH:quinone reductase
MRYVNAVEPGGPEVLKVQETEQPTPSDGEVLIKVAAAGINRPEIFQRQGSYPPPKGASPILGLEVAGEVVEAGNSIDQSVIGQKICALTNGGGYAEFVAVPWAQCLPVPANLSLVEAAALPETCFTVWTNVFDRGQLKPGESFLVHGGSSGIGTTAIQMAAALGSRVFATAGNDEKCRACEKLGAEIAVNYREQDFVEVLSAASEKGVDVILDMVGGDYIGRNMKLAAVDGRIVNIAFLQGSKADVNFLHVLVKRLIMTGSTLRPQPTAAKGAIADALKENVWPHIESGKFKPVIHKIFPLADAAGAHRLMESSEHIGKIVLEV